MTFVPHTDYIIGCYILLPIIDRLQFAVYYSMEEKKPFIESLGASFWVLFFHPSKITIAMYCTAPISIWGMIIYIVYFIIDTIKNRKK